MCDMCKYIQVYQFTIIVKKEFILAFFIFLQEFFLLYPLTKEKYS